MPRVTLLSSITPGPGRVDWKIRVRIIRLWRLPEFKNPLQTSALEMLLVDEEEVRIHAYVKNALITTFEGTLKEGSVYVMENLLVAENKMKFKTTSHAYKLGFMQSTRVTEIEADNIPSHSFLFVPFPDILAGSNEFVLMGKMGISNSYNGTKLLINPNIKHDLEYRERFNQCDGSLSQGVSHTSGGDDFIQTQRMTISDIVDCAQEKMGKGFLVEFQELFNKEFLFIIKISQANIDHNWQGYTAKRVTADKEMIGQFKVMHSIQNDEENCNTEIKSIPSAQVDDNIMTENVIVDDSQQDSAEVLTQKHNDKISAVEEETPPNKVPGKRIAPAIEFSTNAEDEETQASSTKVPKLLTDIKKEAED
ncbi:Nucleic acid-binding, OB-fold [Sesbania bispinosa]|nr:Nucleic acid-binding, OB-fold [Sesbania bispinosa]